MGNYFFALASHDMLGVICAQFLGQCHLQNNKPTALNNSVLNGGGGLESWIFSSLSMTISYIAKDALFLQSMTCDILYWAIRLVLSYVLFYGM